MRDSFLRVAAVSPRLRVADTVYNGEEILKQIDNASKLGVKLLVFPELCLTGVSCGDIFLQKTLIKNAKEELIHILEETKSLDMLIFIGLPWEYKSKLYNCVAAIHRGSLLGLTPKKHLPSYSNHSDQRYFQEAFENVCGVDFNEVRVPFGTDIIYNCKSIENLSVAVEIGDDAIVPITPSMKHMLNGAGIIANPTAFERLVGESGQRKEYIKALAARLHTIYISSSAGAGESTQNVVYSSAKLIVEDQTILEESCDPETEIICTDVDLELISAVRRKLNTYKVREDNYTVVDFELECTELELNRYIEKFPWIRSESIEEYEELLLIQALGLKKRMEHTGLKAVVIGLSGGLDSTLALLVAVKTFELMKLNKNNIYTITMPGFGTTGRTYHNACKLAKVLGVSLEEINISAAVRQHFSDIGQDMTMHDVTYENAQARERTQILMDIANMRAALVVGTGDLSELALGWATYNGDHMSMYSVNASVPKTVMRRMLNALAKGSENNELNHILKDVVDTPVSPELLPSDGGKQGHKTEDIVGPYELHDFFIYYSLIYGFTASKIYRMACRAFANEFTRAEIYKWLYTFYKRFFSQQFKRSCMPDSPKATVLSLSGRADLSMPSDVSAKLWMKELEQIGESL